MFCTMTKMYYIYNVIIVKMETILFKDGKKGLIIQTLNTGHKTIRPPYHLKGALVVQGINFIGQVTVLPDGMEVLYRNEISFSEVKNKPQL